MEDRLIVFNGINGGSGDYLFAPLSPEEVASIAHQATSRIPRRARAAAAGWTADSRLAAAVRFGARKPQAATQPMRFRGWKFGVDPRKLSESGWGVIFTAESEPGYREALAPLLNLRREQAGSRYMEFVCRCALRPGEEALRFLERHGAGPGPANPERMPYYLLLVGDPQQIPFDLQFQLGSQYAVGRICFETLEAYERYATRVASLEGEAGQRRKAVLFGVSHPGDSATRGTCGHLVAPLAERLRSAPSAWDVQAILEQEATKERLGRLLGGDETPSLLFTASHGLGFDCDDPRQRPLQGAILCQDWPGPKAWPRRTPIPEDCYLSAQDVADGMRVTGLVHFHYSCFSAGTPRFESFSHRESRQPQEIAPRPFVARLPQRLLEQGALAVIGHVDRTWTSSFLWERAGEQLQTFESALRGLLAGWPIGRAMDYFSQRRGELAAALIAAIEKGWRDPFLLSGLWTAHNDARSYVILGDPAVRLTVPGQEQAGHR